MSHTENEEVIPSRESVSAENLTALRQKSARLCEMRLCELASIAKSDAVWAAGLVGSGFTTEEILSLLASREAETVADPLHPNVDPLNAPFIERQMRASCAAERALYCSLFAGDAADLGFALTEHDFFPTRVVKEKIAYVRNAFADEAFDVFSEEFTDPRVLYVSTFRDAVGALRSGEAGFCLLPLEEKGGMRLPSVESLLFSEDLKIVSVTPVFGFDGNADLKYALVSLYGRVSDYSPEDDRYLEVRIPRDGGLTLGDVTVAAEVLGHGIFRISTTTFSDSEDGGTYYSVVIKDGGSNFTALLCYFSVFLPTYIPVGLYKNLE